MLVVLLAAFPWLFLPCLLAQFLERPFPYGVANKSVFSLLRPQCQLPLVPRCLPLQCISSQIPFTYRSLQYLLDSSYSYFLIIIHFLGSHHLTFWPLVHCFDSYIYSVLVLFVDQDRRERLSAFTAWLSPLSPVSLHSSFLFSSSSPRPSP